MNARLRTLLTAFGAVLLAAVIVFDASRLAVLSSPQGEGPGSSAPSYAPDGREVAFWTSWRGRPGIWAVSDADRHLRPIAADPAVDGLEPAWSPTGSWIAFVSSRAGNFNIWLVRPDGSGLTQLTRDRSLDAQPTWSPDGRQIAFVSKRDGTRSIWVMNADGSGLRRLTNSPCCQNHPSFSPDGSQIFFEATAPTESHLMIMNADGTGPRRLTTGGFRDSNPSWGVRGILFDSTRTGMRIWMVRPDGSGLEAILDAIGSKPTWSSEGTKFAFSDDGIEEFNLLTGMIRPLVQLKGYFIPIEIMPGVSPKVISLKTTGKVRVAIPSAPVGLPLLAGF